MNSDAKKKSDARYYAANRERILNRTKIYRDKNREVISARIKKKREENPEWQRAHNAKNYQRHKQKRINAVKQWIESNREKHNGYTRKTCSDYVENLDDVYIRNKLSVGSEIQAKEWPAALVELKRAELKLKRLWKQQMVSKTSTN